MRVVAVGWSAADGKGVVFDGGRKDLVGREQGRGGLTDVFTVMNCWRRLDRLIHGGRIYGGSGGWLWVMVHGVEMRGNRGIDGGGRAWWRRIGKMGFDGSFGSGPLGVGGDACTWWRGVGSNGGDDRRVDGSKQGNGGRESMVVDLAVDVSAAWDGDRWGRQRVRQWRTDGMVVVGERRLPEVVCSA